MLESNVVKEPSGVALHQETMLWDLAGQPAYRLVHQLSMEDAALACVLFDCRNETNPFVGGHARVGERGKRWLLSVGLRHLGESFG